MKKISIVLLMAGVIYTGHFFAMKQEERLVAKPSFTAMDFVLEKTIAIHRIDYDHAIRQTGKLLDADCIRSIFVLHGFKGKIDIYRITSGAFVGKVFAYKGALESSYINQELEEDVDGQYNGWEILLDKSIDKEK